MIVERHLKITPHVFLLNEKSKYEHGISPVGAVECAGMARRLVRDSLTYGGMFVGSELSQQALISWRHQVPSDQLDWDKLGKYGLLSTTVLGPFLHGWFRLLDRMLPGTSPAILVRKVLLDQVVSANVVLAGLFVGMSIMDRKEDIFEEYRNKWLKSYQNILLPCIFARSAIIELFRQGKRQCEIVYLLKVPQQTVSKAIHRFNELGHEGDRARRGRKLTANTSVNRKIIKKRLQRNSRVSMKKIVRETGISKSSLLTCENKRVRLERCRQLKHRATGQRWERILFTDEKLLTLEQSHNHQNDRSWSAEVPGTSAIVEHCQNLQSVMVWAGICASGKTSLAFVDQEEGGVKINQEVYRRDILEAVVLPWAQQHFGDVDWTFQQDSAPAHKAKLIEDWCRAHFPDFITSAEWPPYSSDLNTMDYSVLSILQARTCATCYKSLKSLKRSLHREWDRLSSSILSIQLSSIAENFKSRLDLCIAAKASHFETG
ncbi:hypothetical protein LAZ67_1008139 [Cordylochernes scorpioides]|uniref:Paired domain-containing protein n=1 Tax=Cordylochernes scorpioides TaxID=51811 RepID=A0ABY6K0W2_9ARAC|nr:hypothetical protein LAZ67_1008139 [Cordylochernes scorpioides]